MIAFGGVVEDDVEDDFDAGAVEGLDHVAEFVDGAEGRFVASYRLGAGRRRKSGA